MSNPNITPSNFRTNISSLIGQTSLNRSTNLFNKAVRNLSTGIAVHSGRDNPSKFLASTMLTTDIVSMTQAVANCQRAGSVLSQADSALASINLMLNELRGIVTEAANTGPSTDKEIAVLQLQVDSTLDAINRIAASTKYLDTTLLDGSLDFTTYGVDPGKAEKVAINQANFEGRYEKKVSVKILETAQQASLHYSLGATTEPVKLQIAGNLGADVFEFEQNASVREIAEAINRASDSTGVAAKVYTASTSGSIALTSYGTDNDVILTAAREGSLAGNLRVKYTASKEGNDTLGVRYAEGDGNTPGTIEILLQTVPGGRVLTTAEDVVNLLNNAPELKNADGSGIVSAALPSGTTGRGTVSPFADVSYYGDTNDRNRLQFLAPAGTPPIRFVSEPNSSLSVDDTTFPPVYGYASVDVQGFDPGTSFTLRALSQGPQYDETSVVFRDSGAFGGTGGDSVLYDPATGKLTISADFTGRAADPDRAPFTMNDMKALIESDPTVNSLFAFVPESYYDPANPPAFTDPNYVGIGGETGAEMGTFSGGCVSPGMITIHLETDGKGIVKTTANDLVRFFDYPTTPESKAVLDRYGISVSSIDPNNPTLPSCTQGTSDIGTGPLKASYDPGTCTDADTAAQLAATRYPDAVFGDGDRNTSSQATAAAPVATLFSSGGRDAVLTIAARRSDTGLENVEIGVVGDRALTEPTVVFDAATKQLTIEIPNGSTLTANDAVALINSSESTKGLFTASIPKSVPGSATPPDGNGYLRIGDRGTLRTPGNGEPQGAPMLGNSDNASLGITFYSLGYGTDSFISIKSLDGSFPLADRYGNIMERSIGLDVKALINGTLAVGVGNVASSITNDLDMSIWIGDDARAGDVFGVRITGGGAIMQLGQDADYNQQARISMPSVHVTRLGGISGSLDDLRTGGVYSMKNDTKGAYRVVEEAIEQVTFLRGRIGAFQKNQVEVNMDNLVDFISNASEANSELRDADFAEWTSALTRSQLLVQSAVSVLGKTSENARALLGLLQR